MDLKHLKASYVLMLGVFVLLIFQDDQCPANETIIVDTVLDDVDFAGSQTFAELPGPDGRVSFREACIAANNSPGAQTINFAIPMSDWDSLSTEMALLNLESGAYLLTDDHTTIDFSTQTDFTGDTNPNGMEVGVFGLQANGWGIPAIIIGGNHCKIVGLGNVFQRGYAVSIRGNFNRVEGCVISGTIHDSLEIEGQFNGPPAIGNIIGGTEPGQANVLESLLIAGPTKDNIVVGNLFDGDGVRIAGSFSLNLPAVNNRIGGDLAGEGNVFINAGSFSSEGFPTGANIALFNAVNTHIQGNTFGLQQDGITPEGQVAPTGIDVSSSTDTTISDNTIVNMKTTGINHFAGQVFGRAIAVKGDSENTVIQRNRIGTNSADHAIPNFNGITFDSFQGAPVNATVGGSVENGNTIRHSDVNGISITPNSNGVQIVGNLISNSGNMGIDLNGNGISLNDVLDTDNGANGLQNYPIVDSAISIGQTTELTGQMSSIPNTEFLIEFFTNSQYSTTGFGEGETRIGEVTLTTANDGNASFELSFQEPLIAGHFVSAMATDLTTGNTSEFSPSIEAKVAEILLGDINGDGSVGLLDVTPFVTLLSSGEYQAEADINTDGEVNLLDVDGFVQLLTN